MKEYLEDNIFVITAFLTESECEGVLNNTWTDWETDIRSKVSLVFDDKFNVKGGKHIRSLSEGEHTEIHSDQHNKGCTCGYCINNPESVFLYGLVLYLNDNFTGGKLRYPNKNIECTPKIGNLICHPASFEYEHEVLEVESGIRKFLSFFLEEKS